jgi:hypothetical protein
MKPYHGQCVYLWERCGSVIEIAVGYTLWPYVAATLENPPEGGCEMFDFALVHATGDEGEKCLLSEFEAAFGRCDALRREMENRCYEDAESNCQADDRPEDEF